MPDPLDVYLAALEAAADLYMTDQLAGQAAAVGATLNFLHDSNIDSRVRTPLIAVKAAMADHSERPTGNNSKAAMDRFNMAAIAAAITLAKNSGKTVPQGAELVARHIGANNPETIKKLIQHRKNLIGSRGPRDAQRFHNSMVADISAGSKSPQEALNKGLDFLRDRMVGGSALKANYRGLDGPRFT